MFNTVERLYLNLKLYSSSFIVHHMKRTRFVILCMASDLRYFEYLSYINFSLSCHASTQGIYSEADRVLKLPVPLCCSRPLDFCFFLTAKEYDWLNMSSCSRSWVMFLLSKKFIDGQDRSIDCSWLQDSPEIIVFDGYGGGDWFFGWLVVQKEPWLRHSKKIKEKDNFRNLEKIKLRWIVFVYLCR